MSAVVDFNEYGEPVRDEHKRLGAGSVDESEVGMYVRFEPGFGTNVHIGIRRNIFDQQSRWRDPRHEDLELCRMGIDGWERLCELVDEWRARAAAAPEQVSWAEAGNLDDYAALDPILNPKHAHWQGADRGDCPQCEAEYGLPEETP